LERNRENTERKILDAVSRIIDEKDFDSLGINAVAEEAGVGKVLIYRYFGNLNGLLKAWALQNHYWTALMREGTPDFSDLSLGEVKQKAEEIFTNQLNRLNENPLLRKIIRWHLSSGHPVSSEIMMEVESRGSDLMEAFMKNCWSDMDLDVLISLLVGGIYYLALISDQTDVFNGIPLNQEEGKKRIKNGISQWITLLFDDLGTTPA